MKRSVDLRNWDAAQKLVRDWEAGGLYSTVTVKEAWERFKADCVARDVGTAQLGKYDLIAKSMESMSGRLVSSLLVDDLGELREGWKVGATTARGRLGRLRAFFSFCIARGWCEKNPAKLLKPPKEERTQVQPFSDSEIEKIMWALDLYPDKPKGRRDDMRAFVVLLRYSGLRIRDVVTFQKANLKGDRIFVHTQKAKTTVAIPVPQIVVEALKKIEGPGEFYFWSGNGLPKTGVADWQRSLTRLFALGGVSGHAHKFRHTLAVELLSKGVSMENVAKILGNTVRVVEKHYSAWVPSRQIALTAEVEKAWKL